MFDRYPVQLIVLKGGNNAVSVRPPGQIAISVVFRLKAIVQSQSVLEAIVKSVRHATTGRIRVDSKIGRRALGRLWVGRFAAS